MRPARQRTAPIRRASSRPSRRPAADLELVEAAIEGEPDVDAADFARGDEHLALLRRGHVPGRLAAGRRIHGEQQPPAPAAARSFGGRLATSRVKASTADEVAAVPSVGPTSVFAGHCDMQGKTPAFVKWL